MSPAAGAERGHFKLHFHASAAALRGVLDYGLVADDQRAKELVADAYGYARQMGIGRLGLFPTGGESTEGRTIGDMIGLAVTLTDAGLGEHWDDVEKYARNGLLCAQATDLDELRRVSEAGKERPPNAPFGGICDSRFGQSKKLSNKGALPGQEVHDRVLERTLGAFGHVVGARRRRPTKLRPSRLRRRSPRRRSPTKARPQPTPGGMPPSTRPWRLNAPSLPSSVPTSTRKKNSWSSTRGSIRPSPT